MIVLERGEAQVELAGRTYTLKMGHGVFRQLETQFRGLTIRQILALADAGSYTHSSAMLHALLKKHHPEITTDQLDNLIDDAGGMGAVDEIIGPLLQQMIPSKRDLETLGVTGQSPPRPRKARARVNGTGKDSSTKPVASA